MELQGREANGDTKYKRKKPLKFKLKDCQTV